MHSEIIPKALRHESCLMMDFNLKDKRRFGGPNLLCWTPWEKFYSDWLSPARKTD